MNEIIIILMLFIGLPFIEDKLIGKNFYEL